MNRAQGYVLLPQPIEGEAMEILERRGVETVLADNPKPETVAPLLDGAWAVVLRTGIRFTRGLMEKAPRLAAISRTGAGVDNVDLEAATDRGVIVTSSVGVNTTSVAEHCIALILALFKRLPLMDREVRRGNFAVRYKNLPRDLKGRFLGVVGFGKIGSLVAERCHRSFLMNVVAHDPYIGENDRKSAAGWAEFTSLDELLERADVVSVHIPLVEETKGLIDADRLRKMRPGGFLVNTSRGGVVREADLAQALRSGHLAGAGIDVYEEEPPNESNPLLGMENVILTPHSAALTAECVVEMAVKASQRVVDLMDGFVPECVANPEVLSSDRWRGLRRR